MIKVQWYYKKQDLDIKKLGIMEDDLEYIGENEVFASKHFDKIFADAIVAKLKKHKIKPLSVEGTGEGHWILLDYGHVIIHVFYEPVREFFDLEGLWADAKRIEIPAQKKGNM